MKYKENHFRVEPQKVNQDSRLTEQSETVYCIKGGRKFSKTKAVAFGEGHRNFVLTRIAILIELPAW